LVCMGRNLPKVVNENPKFQEGNANWKAIITPTKKPTMPQMTVA